MFSNLFDRLTWSYVISRCFRRGLDSTNATDWVDRELKKGSRFEKMFEIVDRNIRYDKEEYGEVSNFDFYALKRLNFMQRNTTGM